MSENRFTTLSSVTSDVDLDMIDSTLPWLVIPECQPIEPKIKPKTPEDYEKFVALDHNYGFSVEKSFKRLINKMMKSAKSRKSNKKVHKHKREKPTSIIIEPRDFFAKNKILTGKPGKSKKVILEKRKIPLDSL